MTILKELRDAQNVVVVQARERLDLITANADEARQAELEAAHDKAMGEFDRLEGLIVRQTKLAEIEKRAEDLRIQRRPSGEAVEARGVDIASAIEYRTVFAKAICGSLENLTAEERAVLKTGST